MTPEQRIFGLAFNAVTEALNDADAWQLLTVRQQMTDKILAAVLPDHEKQIREQVAADLRAVDGFEWALAGQQAGNDAAQIALGER